MHIVDLAPSLSPSLYKLSKSPRKSKFHLKKWFRKRYLVNFLVVSLISLAFLWQISLHISIHNHRRYIRELLIHGGKRESSDSVNSIIFPDYKDQPKQSSEECSNGSEVSDCCCPRTCDRVHLNKQIANFKSSGLAFTCRKRINYLMSRYGESQRSACVKAVKEYPICGSNCNPDECHLHMKS